MQHSGDEYYKYTGRLLTQSPGSPLEVYTLSWYARQSQQYMFTVKSLDLVAVSMQIWSEVGTYCPPG